MNTITDTKPLLTYSVILPTYNERESLPLTVGSIIRRLRNNDFNYEILVVDDSSPDGTADVYKELQRVFPEVKLYFLQRPGKLGLGTAYKDGLKHVNGDFVILMDADLSHHPKFILDFIKKQREGNYDMVTGSRYIEDAGIFGWDMKRILMSRVANFLAHTLLGVNVTDFTGSYRLYRRDVLETLLHATVAKGYVFQMEIIVRAVRQGYRVGEVPITFVDRLYGYSKLGTSEILQYLSGLFKIFWSV